MRYIVSACLAGFACRFDGKATPRADIVELVQQGHALAVCPEELGGLPTPRAPAEIHEGRVITRQGADLTAAFAQGARAGVALALQHGCTEAILKARSPSCGCGHIYDGSFSGTLIAGDGLFAASLKEAGIAVRPDETL